MQKFLDKRWAICCWLCSNRFSLFGPWASQLDQEVTDQLQTVFGGMTTLDSQDETDIDTRLSYHLEDGLQNAVVVKPAPIISVVDAVSFRSQIDFAVDSYVSSLSERAIRIDVPYAVRSPMLKHILDESDTGTSPYRQLQPCVERYVSLAVVELADE
jgi:hypothetical protein